MVNGGIDSGSNDLASSIGQGHCIVVLVKTLKYTPSASLHPQSFEQLKANTFYQHPSVISKKNLFCR